MLPVAFPDQPVNSYPSDGDAVIVTDEFESKNLLTYHATTLVADTAKSNFRVVLILVAGSSLSLPQVTNQMMPKEVLAFHISKIEKK